MSIQNTKRFMTLFTLLFSCLCMGCKNSGKQNEKKSSSVEAKETEKKDVKTTKIKLDLSGLPKDKAKKDFKPSLVFSEIQKQTGVDFTYHNGMKGQALMVETTGGGSSWLDYDLDGLYDLYLCQGGDPTKVASSKQPRDAFFRQLNSEQFVSAVNDIQINEFGYSQGVSAGDFDGDGFDDLYITNCGRNTFWRNLGDGSFEEMTDIAGLGDGERWSSTSAWADIDLDGDLDLYVCNYVQYDRFNPHPCQDDKGNPAICHPKHVDAWPDALYINQGDGTFVDESKQRGVFGEGNKGLGVAIADFNRDGYPDIYVANDTTANFLFINDGKAHFKELGFEEGCAVDQGGSFQASMGLGIFDYDENGFLDIFLTHYEDESHTLYKNRGDKGFQDVTAIVRLFTPTRPWLGFGTIMADFNNDSLADIFVAQGHVNNTPLYEGKQKMPAALFSFDGSIFHEMTKLGGDYFTKRFIGRGAATCDFDQDGDWDIVVNHQNDKASFLRNDSKSGNFVKLKFIGTESNRTGYGTQVTLMAGGKKYYQELVPGTTYVSSNEPALIFGLGDFQEKCKLEIRWPSGKKETIDNVEVNQSMILVENS